MSTATFAAAAHEALIGPDWIAAHLDDPAVRVVEVDVSPAAYDAGHIPGAVFWNAYGDLRPVGYRPISDDALSDLIMRSAIGPDTTVAFYGYAAYLGYWLLRAYGHAAVCLMDGPRERWTAAGYDWGQRVAQAPARGPRAYALGPASGDLITREAVHELIGDSAAMLVDVRSREEFDGERFWPSGAAQAGGRPGHIPGAVWLSADLVRAPSGELHDIETLRELVRAARVSPERRIVVYCTIGNRASLVWYVLKHVLGYPQVSVYYGSWAEWGTMRETPVVSRGEEA